MTPDRAAVGLERVDAREMDHASDAIVACVVVRNEIERLPTLLDHHRRLGVERFFFVDNGSDDGTIELLLGQVDVHVWRSSTSFRDADYGARWFEAILREHACGNWVVIVDADEFLWFDECERRSLAELCRELDRDGHRALGAALLDLYPAGPLAAARIDPDRSPLESARWFDRRWCHSVVADSGPHRAATGLFGGVRRRLFGGDDWDYCLNKVPLLRFDADTTLVGGQHWTDLPIAPERAAVLHFKLEARLVDLAWQEIERGQRAPHVQEYAAYAETLALHPTLSAYDEDESIEFTGSAQLRALGVIGPMTDPEAERLRARALVHQSDVRMAAGETERAIALLERAALVQSTFAEPVVRLALVHRSIGDEVAARAAFTEALARRPDDLHTIALSCATPTPRPPWADAIASLMAASGADCIVDHDVVATFAAIENDGPTIGAPEAPWIGFVDGALESSTIEPFARRSLPALWASPRFQRRLPACRALFTFASATADWLRRRTEIPVFVVPHPVEPHPVRFDPDRRCSDAAITIVQPGVWHTDVNAICDLPADGRPIRRIRTAPAGAGPLARAVARRQRREGRRVVRPEAVRATTDLGEVDDATIDELLSRAVVLAPLLDGGVGADPVILTCIARGTPVLAPRLPAIVESLGADHPLLYDSLDEVIALAVDDDAVIAAHHRLSDILDLHTLGAFVAAVDLAMNGLRVR